MRYRDWLRNKYCVYMYELSYWVMTLGEKLANHVENINDPIEWDQSEFNLPFTMTQKARDSVAEYFRPRCFPED